MLGSPCSPSASRCSPALCTALGIGPHRGWNSEEQPQGGGLGKGRGNSVGVVWLELSSQQAGPRGDGRDCRWCPCREALHSAAAWDRPSVDATCGLGFAQPSPGSPCCKTCPCCFSEAVLGKKMLPAQHPAPRAGCSRVPPSVPQPTLPSGLLSVWVQPQEASLQASQHCRTQAAVVGLMFQQRQGLIIFQAQKNPKHLWLRPAIARIQCPCPKAAAVAVPSLGGSSFLPFPSVAGLSCASRAMKGGRQQTLPHIPLESAAFQPHLGCAQGC